MELRRYQQDAIRSLIAFWREFPKGQPLVVAPTGSGKSLLIAEICRRVLEQRPNYKILIVSHRAEIIRQNANELHRLLGKPVGVYSAGLGIKQFRQVTCANIQSVFKKSLERIELLIIDECHLVSGRDDSMYGKLIEKCRLKNPGLKIVGLTATAYRLDQGSLIGGLFSDICYDIEVTRLIDEKFLSPLISLPTHTVDLTNIRRSGYDYSQSEMEERFTPLTTEHVREILKAAEGRHHILIFCSGVGHARQVNAALGALGCPSHVLTGEMLQMEREQKLRDFSLGRVRALCNCEVLTTGYNFPAIDCIVLLRATQSCGLYVQMVGRGMRTAETKWDCLVLDFGGNIKRHGPIDCITVDRKAKTEKAKIGQAPSKECPKCGCVVAIRTLLCPNCQAEFPVSSTKIELKPSSAPIISRPESWEVTASNFKIHRKPEKPPILKLSLISGLREVNEFFCFEHQGQAAYFAGMKWLKYGGKRPVPATSTDALNRSAELKIPAEIEVRQDGKYQRITKLIGEKEKEQLVIDDLGINI